MMFKLGWFFTLFVLTAAPSSGVEAQDVPRQPAQVPTTETCAPMKGKLFKKSRKGKGSQVDPTAVDASDSAAGGGPSQEAGPSGLVTWLEKVNPIALVTKRYASWADKADRAAKAQARADKRAAKKAEKAAKKAEKAANKAAAAAATTAAAVAAPKSEATDGACDNKAAEKPSRWSYIQTGTSKFWCQCCTNTSNMFKKATAAPTITADSTTTTNNKPLKPTYSQVVSGQTAATITNLAANITVSDSPADASRRSSATSGGGSSTIKSERSILDRAAHKVAKRSSAALEGAKVATLDAASATSRRWKGATHKVDKTLLKLGNKLAMKDAKVAISSKANAFSSSIVHIFVRST